MYTDLAYDCFKYINNKITISSTDNIRIDIPNVCPNCSHAISAIHLHSATVSYENNNIASIFFCPFCHKYFFTLTGNKYGYHEILSLYPHSNHTQNFSENIEELSPDFVAIYTESNNAENNGLNTICGMGYRKALEFLIKDYAIHYHPDDKEKIISCPLSQCINNYCDDEEIKTLAIACAWIGNDETHYARKHEDYSLEDLKTFIDVIISHIERKMTIERATDLLASRKKD